MENTTQSLNKLQVLSLSNYIRPEIKEIQGKKWVLNGKNNDFYKTIIDAYNGSPTNSAIIDSYSQFIYGKGLTSKDKLTKASEFAMVLSMMPKKELRKICKDFEMFGECSLELNYRNNKIQKIFHVAKQKIAPEVADENGDITGYWYSYDFANVNKYKPERFDAFGFGSGSGERQEIYVISDYQVGQFYYKNPSYVSGLPFAQLENELSNYYINHIQNGLSFGHIINMNSGVQQSEENIQENTRQIRDKLTGSSNAGKFFLNWNDNKDTAITIEGLEVSDAHKQYEYLGTEAKQQLCTAHKLTSPMLVGIKEASGFSSNAEEIKVGFAELMINVIKPKQEILLDAFMEIVAVNGIAIDLDFESLRSEPVVIAPALPAQLSKHICCSTDKTDLTSIADALIEMGEVVDEEEWEEIDAVEVNEHLQINEITLNLAKSFSSFPNVISEQDTSLFKIRYSYEGVLGTERDFCQKMVSAGRTYRKEDITLAETKTVNKGFGANGADNYSIWLYKGGVNCNHFWMRKIYLRKGNTQLTVNEARKMILELDPKDRPKAKWEQNESEVAQIASASNNFWSLNPNYRQ